MGLKILAGVVSAVLLAAFVAPIVWKLNLPALWAVAGIGFAMMLVDLVQSIRSGED